MEREKKTTPLVLVVHAVPIVVVLLLLLQSFFFSVLYWCSCSVSRKHDRDAGSNHPRCVLLFVLVLVLVSLLLSCVLNCLPVLLHWYTFSISPEQSS